MLKGRNVRFGSTATEFALNAKDNLDPGGP
jgi:hypothetical protein